MKNMREGDAGLSQRASSGPTPKGSCHLREKAEQRCGAGRGPAAALQDEDTLKVAGGNGTSSVPNSVAGISSQRKTGEKA